MAALAVRIDDLKGPPIAALLQRHLDLMHSITPAESVHALHFRPAQNLYRTFGFVETGPFANYRPDPHSYLMTFPLG